MVILLSCDHKEDNLQTAASKHSHEDNFGSSCNLERAKEGHRRYKQQDVIDNIHTRKAIMQCRAVDASAGDRVVPVLLDGPAGYDGRKETKDAIDGKVDDEGQEKALGAALSEYAFALEQDGEFDGEVSDGVGDDGSQKRL